MTVEKHIMILARRDMCEAMRVAAGLTIFGHAVKLAFLARALSPAEAEGEEADLLELADVERVTSLPDMADFAELVSSESLAMAMSETDMVISL